MRHMTGSVYARFDKPVHMFRGETMAGIIADEAANNPDRGFVGGYYMETLSLGPSFLAAFIEPGAWGPEFAAMMDAYANTAGMWIVGEDMPQASNRITLSATVKDQWGLAAPNVHFDDHANDTAMRDYAYAKAQKLYETVGAVSSHRTPPYPSTHNLGTCWMSEKPEDGVVDKWGRAHEVPNLFVPDGAVMTTGAIVRSSFRRQANSIELSGREAAVRVAVGSSDRASFMFRSEGSQECRVFNANCGTGSHDPSCVFQGWRARPENHLLKSEGSAHSCWQSPPRRQQRQMDAAEAQKKRHLHDRQRVPASPEQRIP